MRARTIAVSVVLLEQLFNERNQLVIIGRRQAGRRARLADGEQLVLVEAHVGICIGLQEACLHFVHR